MDLIDCWEINQLFETAKADRVKQSFNTHSTL